MSEIKQIEPKNWANFLEEFSTRNKNRRARFNIFKRNGDTQEEATEAHLQGILIEKDDDKSTITVRRVDTTEAEAETRTDTITGVRGVAVQYDTDGSEDVLEITDDQNTLISLRFESKVDGAS
ncbi:MAG: DUF5335 family protein [Pyrinomonadaceae bacterium]